MKLSGSAAVVAAALVLVGGGTVAVHAVTASTDATRLCVQKNAVYGSVYAPGDTNPCQKGYRLVELASVDAVDALQGQLDALQGQVADAQAQADKTKTVSWHGTAVDGSDPIVFSIGNWSLGAMCRPVGVYANDLLDGISVTHTNGNKVIVISSSDGSGGGSFLGGPVAFFAYPRDTQTVQLASIEGPNDGLTITASRTRSDNDCAMTITASAQ
jgi:hypothetical protein